MKKTGVDFLFITGKAEKPVYITLEDRNVEIKDASHLWGKDSYETERILRNDEGGEVLCIGQAGENLVRFACITHRKGRQFGRAGAGAVMGSKNLKAVVIKGSSEIEVADPDGLKEFRKWMLENIISKLESMKKFGTPAIMSLTNESGVLPTKYWEMGSFEGVEKINAEALQKYVRKNTACYACSVTCGKVTRIDDTEVEGPEYETLFAFGALCYNDNLKSIIKANDLCDRYGMDTITAGNVIAFYMACSENGEAEEKINFGDSNAILNLLKKIAFREGIGNVLAEGVRIAAKKLGVKTEPVHVKGLEPPGYDARGLYGMALAYSTSQRGACHMRSCAYRPNLTGVLNRLSAEGQAAMVKDLEDFYCVVDSLVFCRFLCLPVIGMYWHDVAELFKIVTGSEISVEELKKAGERIWNLTREFNLREGVVDEKLPSVFFKPIKHYDTRLFVRAEDYERMVEEYWRLRERAG
jgi:aldehyde:ferredoxin oxidoreductase